MGRAAASEALDSIASDAKKVRLGKNLTKEQREMVADLMAKLGVSGDEDSEEAEDVSEEG